MVLSPSELTDTYSVIRYELFYILSSNFREIAAKSLIKYVLLP